MICPRCDMETVVQLASSPVGTVWEMYLCETCNFTWRSTESDEITDPAKYSPAFKLTKDKLKGLMVNPPIPELR